MLYGIPHVVTDALAGAAAAVEGRAAGRRLRALVLVRAGGGHLSGRGGGRLGRHAGRYHAAYPEIEAERIRVIRNGIDTSEYAADPRTDVLERFGVDLTRPYVIFVGRITRQKGVPVLLRAASGLTRRRSWCCAPGRPTRRSCWPR
jgi:glycosyltransferase involved in cell wall biosynthesis